MRKQWSKSDIKSFLESNPKAQQLMNKKSTVVQEDDLLVVDGVKAFFKHGLWVPTLHALLKFPDLLPKLTVDKGAIKFVVNGADIMRPGITDCEDAMVSEHVVIVDENYSKPIAVGKLLVNSQALLEADGGKVVQNVHRIGDEIWN
jgi:PUA domain protein